MFLKKRYDFHVAMTGDISYDLHTGDGKNGDEFMNQLEPLLSRIPYMVIAGNHENDGRNFSNFQERFWMPHNGYHDNQFYSFDLGPVHWVGLSTEYYGYYQSLGKGPVFTQYNWLKQDLAHANSNRHHTPWIISYLHRPFYCSAEYNDDCSGFDNSLIQLLGCNEESASNRIESKYRVPGYSVYNIRVGHDDLPGLEYPFLQYGVDLGFWGHVHYYERFYPVANKKYWNSGNCYHNAPAPTYVITGSAGCHTPNTPFDRTPVPFSAKRLNDYGYTILTVANRTHIHLQQLSVNKGESVVDEFWLSKDEGFVASDKLRALTPGQDFPKPTLAKIPHNENYMPDWIDIPPIQ
ncbi:Ser/Thr phosphatase family protein [Ancylostoma ceylanicum]|uniref:Ser/Thr phosphatase family protein n=1 Tax=Ancylostoma ceylanicum TaxID=53326 RepID=A0A0D6LG91_9BILA|nr:Ser/Thr phosphatase family protein [Ancylostoma ceylanicum]